MSAIYLIRHGKTSANDRHLYCGSTDLSLSDTGRQELASLRYPIHPVQFYTSGMKRTDETLRLLFGDVPFETVPDLREVDFGDFEMHSYEELRDRADYQTWITGDNEHNVPPNGESGAQMTLRVQKAFHRLQGSDGDIAVITHGGVIAAIMTLLFPAEEKSRYAWQPRPGGGYILENGTYRPLVSMK